MGKVLLFTRPRKVSAIYSEDRSVRAGAVEAARASSAASVGSRGSGRGGAGTATHPLVTVVVPTRGRPELLNRCLASLVLQDFDSQRFEIIVVDDGPSESTRRVVQRWADHAASAGPRIAYLAATGPRGPAAARNRGWRAARGSIVAFTDDDTIASPGWLDHGVRAFRPGVQVVSGRVVMPLTGTPTDYELDAKQLEVADFVTANCFCLRQVLEQVEGFDERFRFAWREDSDLYFRLLDSNAHIVHAPQAVITHPVRPAPWGVSVGQTKKIQFDALLYKKHPNRYRERIRAKPRWDYYVTVAALLAALASALAGRWELAGAAGAIWIFNTARFCNRRLRNTSKSPSHVAEMVITSALIPPVAVFWRAVGALRFRVGFI